MITKTSILFGKPVAPPTQLPESYKGYVCAMNAVMCSKGATNQFESTRTERWEQIVTQEMKHHKVKEAVHHERILFLSHRIDATKFLQCSRSL